MTPNLPLREFRLTRRVQFYEVDAAGIVHFSWYPRYMEEAEHALWREAGLRIHEEDGAFGWPRVAITMDYRAPLRFEDLFEVHIRVAAIGRSSLRYACDILLDGAVMATGTMTIVCVAGLAGAAAATRIPDEVLRRLAPVETEEPS